MDWLMGKGKKNEKKTIVEEKKPYLEQDIKQQRLSGLNLSSIIEKPPKVDEKEWIATHTISLFHNINLLYGTVSEFCTADSCPLMQGPSQTQYPWIDERGKKLKCTAPQYIDYVMTFCQKGVSNQELFPTKYGQTFSENFFNDIRKIQRYLFHVVSHMYYSHFARLREMDLHGYLNVVFQHFTYIVREFSLLDRRETSSLDDLVDHLGLYNTTPPAEKADSPRLTSSHETTSSAVTSSSSAKTNLHSSPLLSKTRGNGSSPIGQFS